MWQRLTERANRVLGYAEEEAARLGCGLVEPEHLLLGLGREPDSVASRVLERMGVPLESLSLELESRLPRRTGAAVEEIRHSPAARSVVNSAYEESRKLHDRYIGTEHLLLGLIRQQESVAARCLTELGADLERTRSQVRETHDRDEESEQVGASLREQIRHLAVLREDEPGRPEWSYLRALQALAQRAPQERTPRAAAATSVLAVDLARTLCRSLSDLRGIGDLSAEQAWAILALGRVLKETLLISRTAHREILTGRTLAMLFDRPTLRTRVTFETGMFQLGGHAISMHQGETPVGRAEHVADVARNLELWVDGIMARVYAHEAIVELARFSRVPVINGLSGREHPCEALADMLTVWERRGEIRGLKLAVMAVKPHAANSLALLGARLGAHVVLACPEWAPADSGLVAQAQADAAAAGGSVTTTSDPAAACAGADVLYTDTWISRGRETSVEELSRRLAPFQVNSTLVATAKPDFLFMHPLPARRGMEVTDEIIDGPSSVVFHQAENRLHVQKAVLAVLLARSWRAAAP